MKLERSRRKPEVVVHTPPLTPAMLADAATWCGGRVYHETNEVIVPTRWGQLTARLGDRIVRGATGEFWPMKPEAFEAGFEPVGDGA